MIRWILALVLILGLGACGDRADSDAGKEFQENAREAMDAARDAAEGLSERAAEMAETTGETMREAADEAMENREDE